MDERQKTELLRTAGRRVRCDSRMRRHTTIRVGGTAEAVYEASDLEGLRRVMAFLVNEGIPYLVAGRGSNLLVRDGGIGGVVIVLSGSLANIGDEASDRPSCLAVQSVAGSSDL